MPSGFPIVRGGTNRDTIGPAVGRSANIAPIFRGVDVCNTDVIRINKGIFESGVSENDFQRLDDEFPVRGLFLPLNRSLEGHTVFVGSRFDRSFRHIGFLAFFAIFDAQSAFIVGTDDFIVRKGVA